jgi:hypothetical protein
MGAHSNTVCTIFPLPTNWFIKFLLHDRRQPSRKRILKSLEVLRKSIYTLTMMGYRICFNDMRLKVEAVCFRSYFRGRTTNIRATVPYLWYVP